MKILFVILLFVLQTLQIISPEWEDIADAGTVKYWRFDVYTNSKFGPLAVGHNIIIAVPVDTHNEELPFEELLADYGDIQREVYYNARFRMDLGIIDGSVVKQTNGQTLKAKLQMKFWSQDQSTPSSQYKRIQRYYTKTQFSPNDLYKRFNTFVGQRFPDGSTYYFLKNDCQTFTSSFMREAIGSSW
jgi:hypothetical protein